MGYGFGKKEKPMPDAKAVSPGRVDALVSLCPKCSSPDLRRSRVRFYEKPRKWLTARRPYRCGDCHARVWRVFACGAAEWRKSMLPVAAHSLDLAEIDRSLDEN
jgi:hypothetical protein